MPSRHLPKFESFLASHTRATVLIVNDDRSSRQICRSAIEEIAEILEAASGAEALAMVAAGRPDLILLDASLPDMDGFDLACRLRERPQAEWIPVVFLTTLTDTASHRRGLELGAVDFLSKPVDSSILRLRIGNLLEREHLRIVALEYQKKLHETLMAQTASTRMLEAIFNASSDALVVIDAGQCIVQANSNADSRYGGGSSLVGRSSAGFSFRDTGPRPALLTDLAQQSRPVECMLSTPEGRQLPVSVGVRAFLAHGEQQFYLLVLEDISEQLALRAEKEQADAELHALVAELGKQKYALDEHAIVSIIDLHGVVTYVNQKFCQVSGHATEELVGQPYRMLNGQLGPDGQYADLWRMLRHGQTWQGEMAHQRRDGRPYWVATTMVPWLGADGLPFQFVAISTDITSRHEAEAALQQARQRELDIGEEIQQRLLFGRPPGKLAGLSIASHTEGSLGVAGDFYTFTRLGEHTLEILTGDVMGKGVNAALIAAGIKSTYRQIFVELAATHRDAPLPSPATLMNSIHAQLTGELIRLGVFVTMSLLRFDRLAQTVTWVNAGHTPILLVRSASHRVEVLQGDSLPVGVLQEEHYTEQTTVLELGDTLLVYSDGLSESMNAEGEQYGTDRMCSVLEKTSAFGASPAMTLGSLRSDIRFFSGADGKHRDDSTAVLIRLHPMRQLSDGSIRDRRAPECFELPRQLDQLAPLRFRIASMCADQPESFVHMLSLAAFEAATNIIRHGGEALRGAPLCIALKRDDTAACVELLYDGLPFSAMAPEPDLSGASSGGFGLFIMENAVDRVSYDVPLPGMVRISLYKAFFAEENLAMDGHGDKEHYRP